MKCSRCNFGAVVELKYLSNRLCVKHFREVFEARVRKNIRVNRLLCGGDRVAVGLSGGKDSATALYLVKKITEKFRDFELFGVTVDMGIPGFKSKNLKSAKSLCRMLDVEHLTFSLKEDMGFTLPQILKKLHKTGSIPQACTFCGVLRRRVLNDKMRDMGVTKIVTGHNLDDEIQTAFMNILRGDLSRIARMGSDVGVVRDSRFVPRVKPLRESLEDEIRLYARLSKLPVEGMDCPYAKSSLRSTVRKILDDLEAAHPGSKYQMLSSVNKLIELTTPADPPKRIPSCKLCGEPSSQRICKTCEILKEL